MDSQIDLTENRDFRKNIFNLANMRRFEYGKYLWEWSSLSYTNYIDESKELVFTGDKISRIRKKIPEWGTIGCCDCCGSLTLKYPWDMNTDTLCRKCRIRIGEDNEREQNSIFRYRWSFK